MEAILVVRGRKSKRQAEVGDSLAILDPDRVFTGHRERRQQDKGEDGDHDQDDRRREREPEDVETPDGQRARRALNSAIHASPRNPSQNGARRK
jgi:hypothetical protein